MLFKDIINPYNYLSKNDNFSIKTPRAVEARGEGGGWARRAWSPQLFEY